MKYFNKGVYICSMLDNKFKYYILCVVNFYVFILSKFVLEKFVVPLPKAYRQNK